MQRMSNKATKGTQLQRVALFAALFVPTPAQAGDDTWWELTVDGVSTDKNHGDFALSVPIAGFAAPSSMSDVDISGDQRVDMITVGVK